MWDLDDGSTPSGSEKMGAAASRCDQKVPTASLVMVTPGNIRPRFGGEIIVTSIPQISATRSLRLVRYG
jgi:hypothetical protein